MKKFLRWVWCSSTDHRHPGEGKVDWAKGEKTFTCQNCGHDVCIRFHVDRPSKDRANWGSRALLTLSAILMSLVPFMIIDGQWLCGVLSIVVSIGAYLFGLVNHDLGV